MTRMIALGVTTMTIFLAGPAEATSRLASLGLRTNAIPVLVAAPEQPGPPEPRFVRDAQRALRELGYAPGPIDGVIGAKTRSALTRYQQAQRLPATGQLDAETMARLDIYLRVLRMHEDRRPEAGRTPAAALSR
jgi:cytosine/adenosine deaminase-related metal-dependent hydrolase